MAAKKQTEKKGVAQETLSEKAKRLFALYPTLGELHFTSDGTAFDRLGRAEAWAKTLSDKKIETIKK